MNKNQVRNQVRGAVKELFDHNSDGYSLKLENDFILKFNRNRYKDEPLINPFDVSIEVWKGKNVYIDTFCVVFYAGDYWGLISEPWICDFTNDIVDCIIKNQNIEEPEIRFS